MTTSFFGAMLKGGDFVTSNIAGAPVPVFLAGAQLDRMYAFAPLSGTAVNVALISHCGTCCIGITSDSAAVPDPEILVEHLGAGFDEVLTLVAARNHPGAEGFADRKAVGGS